MPSPKLLSRNWGLFLLFALCVFVLQALPDTLLKNEPEKVVLSNGMTFIYQKDDTSPITVTQILIQGGRRGEVDGKEGVAFLTTRLCLDLPTQQQLQRLMNQATTRTFFAQQDFSIIKISCLSENLEETIKLSTQILKDPLISGLRIDRTKELMNHYRKLQEDDPINLAHGAAMNAFFSGSPYASNDYGTVESLKNIKKRDVEDYFNRYFRAGNMIITVSSDMEKDKVLSIMQPYFEEFPAGKPEEIDPLSFSHVEGKSITLEKDTQQTLVYMAFPLPKISGRTYVLSVMLQNLLGKGMNSKLWSLRTEKKLAYIVNSRAFLLKEGGMLEAYLETDQSKKESAIAELKKTIEDLYQNGISSQELNIAKIYSKGMTIRENETKDDKTYDVAFLESSGLGFDFLNRILVEIEATTLKEFNAFIREVLNPKTTVSITVGPTQLP
jgi:zinc protease